MQKEKEFNGLNRTIILLVSGKAGTGKSVSCHLLAELLFQHGNFDYTTFPFASGLKELSKSGFGWDGKKDAPGRKLLQDVGQTGRNYNKDIWVDQVYKKIKDAPAIYDFVFIDDWRFPNELIYLKQFSEFDIISIRMIAPDREILKGTPYYGDVSETSLSDEPSDYTYAINNDGDLGSLKKTLGKVLDNILNEENKRLWK